MQLSEFQRLIERTYFERDKARGLGGTFMWFVEEVGELATALREHGSTSSPCPELAEGQADKRELANEFADVLAWLCTLASISGVEMEDAVTKYADGCPCCRRALCRCSDKT